MQSLCSIADYIASYMTVENNTNLYKGRERKPDQTKTGAQPNLLVDISRMGCKKHQSRMNLYTGSNDVLYWLYNSHQISKGIQLLGFGIFTFW